MGIEQYSAVEGHVELWDIFNFDLKKDRVNLIGKKYAYRFGKVLKVMDICSSKYLDKLRKVKKVMGK